MSSKEGILVIDRLTGTPIGSEAEIASRPKLSPDQLRATQTPRMSKSNVKSDQLADNRWENKPTLG